MTRFDIEIARGSTLSESVVVDGVTRPCDLYLDVRLSPQGRRFARLSSGSGQLSLTESGGESRVSIFATAAALSGLPAMRFVYSLHGSCQDRNWTLAEGVFDLLPSQFHEDTIPWAGTLETSTESALAPSIWSSNESLNICCNRAQPLYFEISAPGSIRDVVVDSEYGRWWLESYQGGAWHHNPAQVDFHNKDGSIVTRHRVVYVRYPQWAPDTERWEKGWYKGGTEDCSCNCCDDECRGFFLDIHVTDALGQKAHAEFAVSVDGESPEPIQGTELLVSGCDPGASIIDLTSTSAVLANGCSECPGQFVFG